jgi:transglutaminase-like putative cysteine protease
MKKQIWFRIISLLITGAVFCSGVTAYAASPAEKAPAPASSKIPGGTEEDYSLKANPAIFTDEVRTRKYYNTIRQTILDGTNTTLRSSLIKMELSPEAIAERDAFIGSLSELSDPDKVKKIADYVCNHMKYKVGDSISLEAFFTGGSSGACGTYTMVTQYLCNLANVPCLDVTGKAPNGGAHGWNSVYVDGQWRGLDVTFSDSRNRLIFDTTFKGNYIPNSKNGLLFNKELLVPGSTL